MSARTPWCTHTLFLYVHEPVRVISIGAHQLALYFANGAPTTLSVGREMEYTNQLLRSFFHNVVFSCCLPDVVFVTIVAFLNNQLSVNQNETTEDDQAKIQFHLWKKSSIITLKLSS